MDTSSGVKALIFIFRKFIARINSIAGWSAFIQFNYYQLRNTVVKIEQQQIEVQTFFLA